MRLIFLHSIGSGTKLLDRSWTLIMVGVVCAYALNSILPRYGPDMFVLVLKEMSECHVSSQSLNIHAFVH